MSIRKKGKRWQIDYYDGLGKRIRRNFRTKPTAEAALAEAMRIKDRIRAGLKLPQEYTAIRIEAN